MVHSICNSCAVNCLDRHAKENGEKTAVIWERNRTKDQEHGVHECISYRFVKHVYQIL